MGDGPQPENTVEVVGSAAGGTRPQHDAGAGGGALRACRRLLLPGLLGLPALALLLLNPGYFSSDELDLVERLRGMPAREAIGALDLASQGLFYRPLGYHLLGVQLLASAEWPHGVHALSVLHHVVNAYLVFLLARRVGRRDFAFAVALAFLGSPVAVGAVGWAADAPGRGAVTFSLAALLAGVSRSRARAAALAGACTAVGLLCKESTAVVPLALLALRFVLPGRVAPAAVVASGAVVAAYAGWRLVGHFLPHGLPEPGAAYAPDFSLAVLGRHWLTYFAVPFVPWRPNIEPFHAPTTDVVVAIAAGAALHGALLVVAARRRPAIIAAYLILYSLPLLPVVALPKTENHYLYGSAVAFAFLLVLAARRRAAVRWFVLACIAWTSLRGAAVAGKLLVHGHVESRARATIEAALPLAASEDGPLVVRIAGEPDAPVSVLRRAFGGLRHLRGRAFEAVFADADDDVAARRFTAHFLLDRSGRLRVQ